MGAVQLSHDGVRCMAYSDRCGAPIIIVPILRPVTDDHAEQSGYLDLLHSNLVPDSSIHGGHMVRQDVGQLEIEYSLIIQHGNDPIFHAMLVDHSDHVNIAADICVGRGSERLLPPILPFLLEQSCSGWVGPISSC